MCNAIYCICCRIYSKAKKKTVAANVKVITNFIWSREQSSTAQIHLGISHIRNDYKSQYHSSFDLQVQTKETKESFIKLSFIRIKNQESGNLNENGLSDHSALTSLHHPLTESARAYKRVISPALRIRTQHTRANAGFRAQTRPHSRGDSEMKLTVSRSLILTRATKVKQTSFFICVTLASVECNGQIE